MKADADFLNNTLDLIKKTEMTVASLPFHRDDIRACFFLKLVTCLNSFYFNYVTVLTMTLISIVNRLELPPDVPSDCQEHIQKLIHSLSEDTWRTNYGLNTNRHLMIDAWTAFELCMDVFLRHAISEDELSSSSRPARTLTDNVRRSAHSTVKTKIDALYTMVQYPPTRQIDNDKRFLLFFAKMRNSMHNNFVYYGNDYEYDFCGTRVVFRNGEFLRFSAIQDERSYFLLELIEELAHIFEAIIRNADCSHFVIDPVLNGNLQE